MGNNENKKKKRDQPTGNNSNGTSDLPKGPQLRHVKGGDGEDSKNERPDGPTLRWVGEMQRKMSEPK